MAYISPWISGGRHVSAPRNNIGLCWYRLTTLYAIFKVLCNVIHTGCRPVNCTAPKKCLPACLICVICGVYWVPHAYSLSTLPQESRERVSFVFDPQVEMTLKGAIEVICFHLSDFFQKMYVSEYFDHACHKTKQRTCIIILGVQILFL